MRLALAILIVGVFLASSAAGGTLTNPVTHDLQADYDASAQTGWVDGDLVTVLHDSAGADDAGTPGHYGGGLGVHFAENASPSGLPALRFDTYGGTDRGDWFNIPSVVPRQVFFVAKETRTGRTSTVMGQSSAINWHTGGSASIFAGYGGQALNWTKKLDGAANNNERFALGANFNLSIALSEADAVYTNRLCSDRDGYGYRAWGGDIYEVLIYTQPLTAEEENAVGYYLQTKWGLTGAYTGTPPAPDAHPGDANADGVVDLQDFGALKDHFGAVSDATWDQGDFNADGGIDLQDFGILKDHFGHTNGDSPVSAVPEPVTLLTLPAMAMVLRRRR